MIIKKKTKNKKNFESRGLQAPVLLIFNKKQAFTSEQQQEEKELNLRPVNWPLEGCRARGRWGIEHTRLFFLMYTLSS